MNKFCLFLFIVIGFASFACNKTDSKTSIGPTAEVNAAAPDFTLKDLTGKNISLSDYRGKVVLLEFWATWCPPCKAALPALLALNKKYEPKGFTVIGLSIDTDSDVSEKLRQFSALHTITYPILLADEETQKKYNIVSIPTSFLIGKDGKVIDIYRGYSEEFDNKVSAQIEKLL